MLQSRAETPERWNEWARVTQPEADEARAGRGVLPGSGGREDEEAAEDAVCLGTLVNAALGGVLFDPDLVPLLELEHRAPRHHLEVSLAVGVTEAQGAWELAPPGGHDGQADVPLGHHLEGEIVVAWHSAFEPARVAVIAVFLVGDDHVEDDHVAARRRIPPYG